MSFHDNNTRKFSVFEKNDNFFWVLRDLRVQEGLQCDPNSPFCDISSSDSGSGKSLPRVPKSSKSRGGVIRTSHLAFQGERKETLVGENV